MHKLRIMRDGFEIARLPCPRDVCIWNLAVTLEKAGSEGRPNVALLSA